VFRHSELFRALGFNAANWLFSTIGVVSSAEPENLPTLICIEFGAVARDSFNKPYVMMLQ
jgi:hypothetical protein